VKALNSSPSTPKKRKKKSFVHGKEAVSLPFPRRVIVIAIYRTL
jgi:hypothetical protein